jgi:CRP-like cAMP-binding protein
MYHNMSETTGQRDLSELHSYGIDHKIITDDTIAKDLLSMFNSAKKATFAPQQIIYHEGLSADTIYVISKGLVKLLSYLPNGRARIVRLHGPGNVIGLSSIIESEYEHTAVAVNDLEVLKIPANAIKQVRHDNPEKFLHVSESWYEYLRAADAWITQFSTGSIRARVARLITFLSYLESDTDSDYVQLLTGEEMAAVLGVTPESVSRVLADFKRQKVLQTVDGQSHELYKRDVKVLETYAQD